MTTRMEEKYFRHGHNLALFRKMGDLRDHWDEQWMKGSIKAFLESSRSGALGEFEHPFISYLPKKGPILEAGCGTGRYVSALRVRGYDMEGRHYHRMRCDMHIVSYNYSPVTVNHREWIDSATIAN